MCFCMTSMGGGDADVPHATGITVSAGMLGVTLFGLLLTPLLHVALRALRCEEGVCIELPPAHPAHA